MIDPLDFNDYTKVPSEFTTDAAKKDCTTCPEKGKVEWCQYCPAGWKRDTTNVLPADAIPERECVKRPIDWINFVEFIVDINIPDDKWSEIISMMNHLGYNYIQIKRMKSIGIMYFKPKERP